MPVKPSPFLKAALFYAQRLGWPVFPVKPRSKKPPLIKNGCLDATVAVKQIREWWTRWPAANVAIRTGVRFWVLDIDPRHDGDVSRDRLVAKYGPIADTLRQITGGGGWQYFYELPEQAVIQGLVPVSKDFPGIDTRGENNYVIVPPSIHPETGNPYAWDTAKRSILEEPVQPASAWLIEWVLKASRNGQGFQPPPEMIPHGTQHRYLVSEAGKLRDMGLGYEEIVEAVWQTNLKRCERPGPRKNIEQIARSAMKGEPKHAIRTKPQTKAPNEKITLPEPDSVDQILDSEIALPEPLVEGLFPRRGLCLMTGAQRSGKTIFAAQMAIALATKQPLLKNYKLLAAGPVIVFEKDDPGGMASFKEIYIKSQVARGTPIDYYGKEKIPIPLGQGFLEWLEIIIPKRGAVLVVLDSYTAMRPERTNGGDIVRIEREDIAGLDELAKRLNCLILLLHHESITTRSNGTLEWDARGAGTYGMSMAAECQMAITRFRDLDIDSPERLVRFRSRHMKEHQAVLFYNPKTGLYEHMLDGPAAPYYPLIHDIKRHIHTETFAAKQVEEALAVSRATAFRTLGTLKSRGILWHVKESGAYRFSPDMEMVQLPPR